MAKEEQKYKSRYFNSNNFPTLEELHSITSELLIPTNEKWVFEVNSSFLRNQKVSWSFKKCVNLIERTKDYVTVPSHYRFWLDEYVEQLICAYYNHKYSIRFENRDGTYREYTQVDRKADRLAMQDVDNIKKQFK